MRKLLLVLFLLTASTAGAQIDDEIGGVSAEADLREILSADLETACEDLDPGRTVQLALADDTSVTGSFAGWDGERLLLLRNGKQAGFGGVDIMAVWARERATGAGMTAGAVLGTVGGGAFMGLVAYVLDSQGEDNAPYLPLILGGMLAGGLGGGLVGAGVGSALPNWELVYATPGADLDRPASEPVDPDDGSGFGNVSILAGAASNLGVDNTHSDFAWRLSLLADTNRLFTYGLEFGHYMTGNAHRPHAPWPEPDASVGVWHAGGAAHLDVTTGPVRPFVSVGLGYYNWNDTFLGYNLGAGLKLKLARGVDWIGEYRYHTNVQRLTETEPQMATFLAGASIAW